MHVYYTEKRDDFKNEANQILHDLKTMLYPEVKGLENVRVIYRYLIEGEGSDEPVGFNQTTDMITSNMPKLDAHAFIVELLPGQFDQDAYILATATAMKHVCEPPAVRIQKIYTFDGNITESMLSQIKTGLINPVESREISFDLPTTLQVQYPEPEATPFIDGFIHLEESAIMNLRNELGITLDLADLLFIQKYFSEEEKRNPSITEIRMLDTYWSDHCRHTTFLSELDHIQIDDPIIKASFERYLLLKDKLGRTEKPITLMDMATIGAKALKSEGFLKEVDESEEVNAACVKISAMVNQKSEDWLLYFKNETHNHPTEMEPYGGAATCLGGGIRDPLSGRSFVHQAMRITGAADPRAGMRQTRPGKLAQRKICRTAAQGYSDYGNQVGGTSGHIHEIYHPGYAAKRMELGALVAAAPTSYVVRKKPVAGDVVFLLGGKTGRDGVGGATGSSKTQEADALQTKGAEVQRGDAPEEHKIIRLFRNPEATVLIKRCNDFGAGGVSVAIAELADGLDIHLNAVPLKYPGLSGTDIAISESQERMACVVAAQDIDKFIALADAENLDATIVATVTDNHRVTMFHNGQTIVSLSRDFLNSNGTQKHARIHIQKSKQKAKPETILNEADIHALLSDLLYCSQKGLIEQFDSTIGGGTMLAPLGGKTQLTPAQTMVAKLPVLSGTTTTCSLMAHAYDPYLSAENPYDGAKAAVTHSIAKVIASGGSRSKCWLTFQEYFERLGDDAMKWGKPAAALLGALDAQMEYQCAALGGKDSMSGTFEDIDVPPTLVSFAVSVADTTNIISPEFKTAGNKVYHLTPNGNQVALFDTLEQLIAHGKIKAAWAVGSGGITEGVAKMCFGNQLGFKASIPLTATPAYGSFIVESEQLTAFEAMCIGEVSSNYVIETIHDEQIDLNGIQQAFEHTLEEIYPSKVPAGVKTTDAATSSFAKPLTAQLKPKFLIPIFPGTNAAYDIQNAIESAGGNASVLVIKNRSVQDILQSISQLAKEIMQTSAIILPGGDVSTDYIEAMFAHDFIKDAVYALLEKNGLIMGSGGGFRALTRLQLLPNLTFAANNIGRHQAVITDVTIMNNNGPWFSDMNLSDVYTVPVSSKYGKLIASDDVIQAMVQHGQIATQYVNNPFGAAQNIEAVTSECGRILGTMAHFERISDDVLINIHKNKTMNLFKNAMQYFS